MNGKKWLVSNPAFLAAIGLMALFNYFFDQAFKGAVYHNPNLSFLYVFQYQFILPLINFVLLSVLFYGARRLRGRRNVVNRRWTVGEIVSGLRSRLLSRHGQQEA